MARKDITMTDEEVLTFLGIEPGMTVADLIAGGGYYSEILCRAVGSEGKVYVQNNAYVLKRFGKSMIPAIEKRLGQPAMSHCVRHDSELDALDLPAGELDAVLLVLFYHDTYWQKTDRAKMNAEILRVLKPGGVFGVVDHFAEDGSGSRDVETLHRGDAEMVKREILAAGFVLDAESDEDAGQARDLLEAEEFPARQELVLLPVDLRRHAVGAAEVAAIRHRDAQIAQRAAQAVARLGAWLSGVGGGHELLGARPR